MAPKTGHTEDWSDLDLIAAANRGDRAAMESLYRRYREWVLSLATRYCRVPDDAFDVMQETFIYLFGKFPGFELTCQMKTFLYPVVRNLSLNYIRKQSRVSQMSEAQEGGLVSEVRDYEGERRDLAETVSHLPEAYREVILLRFADGLSLAEISEGVGVPLGTVKSRLHNALQRMKDSL